MVLLLGVLYFLVIFSSFSSCEKISKAESQNQILDACKKSLCNCATSRHKHFGLNITWSRLNLNCKSFEQLQAFSNVKKIMVYDSTNSDGDTEAISSTDLPMEVQDIIENMGENYSSNEKNAFEVIEAVVTDEFTTIVTSNCSKTGNTICFDNEKNDDLKYITRLEIVGKSLLQLGTKDNPILQLFPNLRKLTISSNAKTLEIQLVELLFLRDFYIYVNNAVVKLYCAFDNELCLSNPKGLDHLHFEFKSSSESALKVFGKLNFPKKINLFQIKVNERTAYVGNNHTLIEEGAQTNVFKNIEFELVNLDLLPEPNYIFNIKDFSGITVHTSFIIRGEPEHVFNILPSVYDTGLQYPLVIDFYNRRINLVPFLDLKATSLDESLFTLCNYGKKLLNHAFMNEYQTNDGKILIIRGFHLSLTQIMAHAKKWATYSSIKIIRVYAYNFDVDLEPSAEGLNLETRKLVINYVNVGTTKKEIAGIKKQKADRSNVPYAFFFPIQFISMKSKHDADPIFMRAAATCLIMNIGSRNKFAPNSLIKSDQRLSTWYDVIQQSPSFDKTLYTSLEISRTQAAYNYLEEYITWRDNQNTNVTRVPFLSLQVLSQNIQILAQAGRDIRDKSRHLQSLASLEELKTMVGDSLKKTLQSIGGANTAILKASLQKSVSLGEIELRKKNDIGKQINDSQKFIDYLTNEFSNFAKEVEAETINFKNGVILSTSLAVAEAAAEGVNCVLGIFSGGFNPAKALKTARNAGKLALIIPKLMKVLKTIKNLIQNRQLLGTIFKKVRGAWKTKTTKLTEFFKRQKNVLNNLLENKATVLNEMTTNDLAKIKNFVESGNSLFKSTADMVKSMVSFVKAERTVRIGFNPGNALENIKIDELETVEKAFEEFKKETATIEIENSPELNSIDVFKWTIAKDHVVGMVDTTLSNDVPEATNYRTALLKLITTGETKTQASIDQAALEISFIASEKAWDLYFFESVSIATEISKIEVELESMANKNYHDSKLRDLASKIRSAADLDVEWEKLAIKLEFIRLNEEYCNAYYYFHLEKCQEDLVVNPSDDLEKILSIQNRLLYQSNQNLRQLYPPPQTFTDFTITIKKQKYCDCLNYLKTTAIEQSRVQVKLLEFENSEKNKDPTTFEDRFNAYFKDLKDERNRLKDDMYDKVKTCLEESGVNFPADLIEKEHNFTNQILMNCTNNKIENLKKDRLFSYQVNIDSPYFSGRERVRIDEVKIILKGAKTLSGIVEIYAESTGVSEDRYNGQCYKFIGDKWIRTISYYSKNAVSRKRSEISAPNNIQKKKGTQLKAIKDIKKMIKKQSEDIKTLKEEVQILLKEKQDQVSFIDSGNIHESFQGIFRAPTVFTTWLFFIPENRNPGLNLENLEEIELKFSGSFITTGLSEPIFQCKAKDQDEVNPLSNDVQKLFDDQTPNSDRNKKVNQKTNHVENIHKNQNAKQTAVNDENGNSVNKFAGLKTGQRLKHKRRSAKIKNSNNRKQKPKEHETSKIWKTNK